MSKLFPPSNVLGSYHLSMSDSFWEELQNGVELVKNRIKMNYQDYLTEDSIIKINVTVSNSELESMNSVKKISLQVGIEEHGIESPFVAWALKKKLHHLDFITGLTY